LLHFRKGRQLELTSPNILTNAPRLNPCTRIILNTSTLNSFKSTHIQSPIQGMGTVLTGSRPQFLKGIVMPIRVKRKIGIGENTIGATHRSVVMKIGTGEELKEESHESHHRDPLQNQQENYYMHAKRSRKEMLSFQHLRKPNQCRKES